MKVSEIAQVVGGAVLVLVLAFVAAPLLYMIVKSAAKAWGMILSGAL